MKKETIADVFVDIQDYASWNLLSYDFSDFEKRVKIVIRRKMIRQRVFWIVAVIACSLLSYFIGNSH